MSKCISSPLAGQRFGGETKEFFIPLGVLLAWMLFLMWVVPLVGGKM